VCWAVLRSFPGFSAGLSAGIAELSPGTYVRLPAVRVQMVSHAAQLARVTLATPLQGYPRGLGAVAAAHTRDAQGTHILVQVASL
jgi:hypothetical protein